MKGMKKNRSLEDILLMTFFRCYLALQSCSINFMHFPPKKKLKNFEVTINTPPKDLFL